MYVIDQEQEKKEILKRYRRLLSVWKSKSENERRMVRKAFNFALEAHKDMRRKSGEPYIFHPIEVARICVEEIGLGTTSIISALLHDVVEDTEYTLGDIRDLFGPVVEQITDGLTKVKGFVHAQPDSLQAETFKKILQVFLSADTRVILIKLADRLHNMRTLGFLSRETQLKISSETLMFFAPLANRLGLFSIKSELEDLVLKYTEPEAYDAIKLKLRETEADRARFIRKFILPIKKSLSDQGFKATIVSRVKSSYSIWQKLQKKDVRLEEIYDLFAVRIIIDSPREREKLDCWRVYSIVTDTYTPNRKRLRDWITTPKANGYESLHTTVMSQQGRWVEVQIRTSRMDEIAERGYAAHWKYKQQGESENAIDQWLRQAKDILDGSMGTDALELVSDFTRNLFSEEIFVFTPKGDQIKLPVGATALDFAYYIHSEVGNTAIGAKQNLKLVALNQKLSSGDQVEIITSARQRPKEEWLDLVITGKARAQIKESLREDEKLDITRGKEMWAQILRDTGYDDNQENLIKLMHECRTDQPADIYLKVSKGILGAEEIKAILKTSSRESIFSTLLRPFLRHRNQENNEEQNEILDKIRENPGKLLLGEDIKEIHKNIASCCQPVPGDDVIGLRVNHEIIEIHRTNCPKALKFMSTHGDRIVKTKWKPQEDVSFLAAILILSTDRRKMLMDIVEAISHDFNLNIRSLHIETSGQISKGIAMVYVPNTATITTLISGLQKIPGVIKVKRINHLDEINPMASE